MSVFKGEKDGRGGETTEFEQALGKFAVLLFSSLPPQMHFQNQDLYFIHQRWNVIYLTQNATKSDYSPHSVAVVESYINKVSLELQD